jgi:hypothetical protein
MCPSFHKFAWNVAQLFHTVTKCAGVSLIRALWSSFDTHTHTHTHTHTRARTYTRALFFILGKQDLHVDLQEGVVLDGEEGKLLHVVVEWDVDAAALCVCARVEQDKPLPRRRDPKHGRPLQ